MSVILTIGIPIFFLLFLFLCLQVLIIIFGWKCKKTYTSYTPPISILIPAYNEEKGIEKCIESVLHATYKGEREIIVIDDGSTDSTIKLLKQFPVHILTQKHKGKVAALQKGVQKAKHDIIVTLDADTIIEKDALTKIIQPLQDSTIASTTGICKVANTQSLLGMFAQVEYQFINTIRLSFTHLTKTSIWFFGFFAAYKKEALRKIGGFSKETLTEDMDSCLSLNKAGYNVASVPAFGYTYVPQTLKELFKQRLRWWIGSLQNLRKHKTLFLKRKAITFLFVNQYWWSFFAFVSLPFLLYQFMYWLPPNPEIAFYTFRWLSALGPLYVIYMIPHWGISYYGIFGVLGGIVSAIMLLLSIYKQKVFTLKNCIVVFFYFPYTIILNLITTVAVILYPFKKKSYFKK